MENAVTGYMEKGKPLSKEEIKGLLQLIESSPIITNKCTNAHNNRLKKEEWKRLTECFNATAAVCRRTPQQLRLKWENLKKSSRKRSKNIKMNRIQTGDCAGNYIPPDDILDRVSSLLRRTANGLTVPFGGDKEEVFDGDDGEDECGGTTSNTEDFGGWMEGTLSITTSIDADGNQKVKEESTFGVDNEHVLVGDDGEDECGATTSSTGDSDDDDPLTTSLDADGNQKVKEEFTNIPKIFTFSTSRAVKNKKVVQDSSKTARNVAIAEYYQAKRKCLDLYFNNILLQHEKLTLEKEKLKLEIEKLKEK